jgi:hypothetical protein
MRYIRQDTTKEDELKIENRLEALKWRWDFKNVMAFIIVLALALLLLYAQIYAWYCNNLPTIAYRNEDYDEGLKFSLQMAIAGPAFGIFKKLFSMNYFLAYSSAVFCFQFNMFFYWW